MPMDIVHIFVYNTLARSNKTDLNSNRADNTHKSILRTCEPTITKTIDTQVV